MNMALTTATSPICFVPHPAGDLFGQAPAHVQINLSDGSLCLEQYTITLVSQYSSLLEHFVLRYVKINLISNDTVLQQWQYDIKFLKIKKKLHE